MAGRISFTDLPNQIPHPWHDDSAAFPRGVGANFEASPMVSGVVGTIPVDLKEEVAELRHEISEHNRRLLELVRTRLEVIGNQYRNSRVCSAVDTPPLSPVRHELPERLSVVCSSGSSYAGCYMLHSGRNCARLGAR